MKIGFIKPNYPFEKRVALFPEHVSASKNEFVVETGFGENLDIDDAQYISAGATIMSREQVYATCDIIVSVKLIQPSDYDYIREGQIIVGWTHPLGSGAEFMRLQAIPKKLYVIDLDNIYPSIYYGGKQYPIPFIRPNFIRKNSVNAGICAVFHALLSYGALPDASTKVAILSSGNVAQGAFSAISKFNADVRMFYRKTMSEFYASLGEYDIVINGIEVENPNNHILNREQLRQLKRGCLIIDAAADAGNAIEGTHFANIGEPLYREDGLYYYEVNNVPSVLYRTTSKDVADSFAEVFYNKDIEPFLSLVAK